jgi:hypothetical protein
MLNKLKAMINEESNIVVLQYGLREEESLHLTNYDNMLATVSYNEEEHTLEIAIEEYDAWNEEYYLLASKEYKTAKGAYNYLYKMLA